MTYRWLRRRIDKLVRRVLPAADAVESYVATEDGDVAPPPAGPIAIRDEPRPGANARNRGRVLEPFTPMAGVVAMPADRAATADFEAPEDPVTPEAVLDEIEAAADRLALAGLRATSAAMRRCETHGSAGDTSRRIADLARQAGEAADLFDAHVAALRPERSGIEAPRPPAGRVGADLPRDRMLRRVTRSVAATVNGFEMEAAEAAAPGAGAVQATGI